MFIILSIKGSFVIVHGRVRRASRTICRIKTMLAGCESVRKNFEIRTLLGKNEETPLVAVARQEFISLRRFWGTDPFFR
jgi:hypothetical protein